MDDLEMDETTRTQIEAAAFRHLLEHFRKHSQVQNIDLMNLAYFCRNCLSKWYRAAAAERGEEITYDQAREIVYGMPYEDWKEKHQGEASSDQMEKFKVSHAIAHGDG